MYESGICLLLCKSNSLLSCLCDARSLQSGNLNSFTSHALGKCCNVDLVTVLCNDIHHVDSHHNRDAKLHQLCGKVKVTLQVRSIYDIQDRIGTLGDQVVSGNNLLQCVRRQGVNTRKVHDDYVFVSF